MWTQKTWFSVFQDPPCGSPWHCAWPPGLTTLCTGWSQLDLCAWEPWGESLGWQQGILLAALLGTVLDHQDSRKNPPSATQCSCLQEIFVSFLKKDLSGSWSDSRKPYNSLGLYKLVRILKICNPFYLADPAICNLAFFRTICNHVFSIGLMCVIKRHVIFIALNWWFIIILQLRADTT